MGGSKLLFRDIQHTMKIIFISKESNGGKY